MSAYDAGEVAAMHAAEADAHLATAQALGVGGDEWYVERGEGDGIAEDVVRVVRPEPITGYVFLHKPKAVLVNGALVIPDDEWRFNGPGHPDLLQDDVLISALDPNLRFLVMTAEKRSAYLVAGLEQVP